LIAAALVELIEPAADAVTRFETENGWRIEAYYADPPDPNALSVRLAELLAIALPTVIAEAVREQNWVELSQAALPPVAAGRFIVHGRHDRRSVPRGPNAIEIDAGEAFGTAHHATTQGCLFAIDRLSRRRAFHRVLDLGCGSGVLAIAAQRAWPKASVTALDNDPEAVRVAVSNARRNGAASIRVRLTRGAPESDLRPGARHDFVIANILAGPLIALAPLIAAAIAHGGTLVLSGLLARETREVKAAYLARGFAVTGETQMAGWATLIFVRRGFRTRPKTARHGHPSRERRLGRGPAHADDRR
jgi:ribosomal protein L11 methyltransferase